MNPSTNKLKISKLQKTYGSVTAVAGVDLDVAEGEFVTLLGPSGSGKTTLLMMVAGLTWPDSGDVWIDNRSCTYLPSHKRDIGMVFQNYALFPHLSVFENIAFPLRMRRTPDAEIAIKVKLALERVQLPDVGDRLPSALSGGQQQRIALARCIVYEPSIILMDEPLGALDKKLREQMQFEIKALHEQLGITALYVTHDQEEAMVMSDRICLFNSGRIEQIGPPDEIYFSPRTQFAASFLGESNIFAGRVGQCHSQFVELHLQNDNIVRASVQHPLIEGQQVHFMVRPESVSVTTDRLESGNTVTGVVKDIIMTGGATKCFVQTADGSLVSAKHLTTRSRPAFQPGDTVWLGWASEDTVILQ